MSSGIVCIDENDLSVAWAKAFLSILERGVEEIAPLVVRITGFSDGIVRERDDLRQILDASLKAMKPGLSCETVANTIFPQSLWNPQRDRQELYIRYVRIRPRLAKCPLNVYGVYFARMIAFGEGGKNQLEHIIQTFQKGNHRRSALQAAIFDPNLDHTDQQRRMFPCLQQVAFAPIGRDGLSVTGFYPMQYLFERAYGNYLGLCRLGSFVAHEVGRQLVQMQCFVGVAKRGEPGKTTLKALASNVKGLIGNPR